MSPELIIYKNKDVFNDTMLQLIAARRRTDIESFGNVKEFVTIDSYVFSNLSYSNLYNSVSILYIKRWLRDYGPGSYSSLPMGKRPYPKPEPRDINTINLNEYYKQEFLDSVNFYDKSVLLCKCFHNEWKITPAGYGVDGECTTCGNKVYWGE